jgi:hypothetical protein
LTLLAGAIFQQLWLSRRMSDIDKKFNKGQRNY